MNDDESREDLDFTAEEKAALKEVASAWRNGKGFLKVTRYIGGTLKWFAVFSVSWAAFKLGFLNFLGIGGK